MTILIKLGGSLITDKTRARTFRRGSTTAIVRQIARVLSLKPDIRLVIGHGSGSFGHFEAQRHHTIDGVSSEEDWLGFAKVGEAAVALSQLVLNECLSQGLAVMRIQPSSLTVAERGRIKSMDTTLIKRALNSGVIPLLHGDIALDSRIGGTIVSTEAIFAHLTEPLSVSTIILLGEVDGVLDEDGQLIASITPSNVDHLRSALSEAHGVDVTGGMLRKVEDMLILVKVHPELRVMIANGNRDRVLEDLLINAQSVGTVIQNG